MEVKFSCQVLDVRQQSCDWRRLWFWFMVLVLSLELMFWSEDLGVPCRNRASTGFYTEFYRALIFPLHHYLDCLNLSSISSWKNSNSFFLTWIRLNLFKIISASSRSNPRFFDFPFITKCVDFYYKVRQLCITKCVSFLYYKVRQVLQSVSKCITKCGRYYKV